MVGPQKVLLGNKFNLKFKVDGTLGSGGCYLFTSKIMCGHTIKESKGRYEMMLSLRSNLMDGNG
jgi:hypothetical protein